ncbi:peptidase M56 BlaR1 [Truepera radiovictrix DSM 17093]|uniref:Peptidase M56 BlaR1 n=1 Tax=Truepera radiovictrix (strain DSM 17093 / CIP 108686 / LMG 22925 / RQ-24) TaxID=649638 RepID=D7CR21_TRURR|nr:peptidase M56 BlaR1 [Truepera radiovictrix DSM 17093]
MSARALLEHPLAEAVGWALLHSLWQGALVGALVALGLFALRRPQHRYALGCGALLLMVVLPLLTGVLHYRDLTAPLAASGELGPSSFIPSGGLVGDAAPSVAPPASSSSSSAIPTGTPSAASSSVAQVWGRVSHTLTSSAPWFTGLWLVGVALSLLRLLGSALYAARFGARHRTPAPEAWQQTFRTLAGRLGLRRVPRLVLSSDVDTPLVLGVLRPLVVLPVSALTGVPAAQLSAVLLHELAHIRRYDPLVNLLQCLLETLLFYHPAVWWISRAVRREREACCDDLAVAVCGDARLYARALVGLEALRQREPALALAATDKPLLERVRRLLGMESDVRSAPSLLTVLLVVTLSLGVGLFLTLQPAVAQEEAPSTSLQVAEDETVVTGRVLWQGEPVAGVRLELHSRLELDDDGVCCREPRVLASTTSDEDGTYTFRVSAARAFTIWAYPPTSDYLPVGYDHVSTPGIPFQANVQLMKAIKELEPALTYGVNLTPTLSWQPLPEAARYGVSITKLNETDTVMENYQYTAEPQFTVETPLEENALYYWVVEAYDETGTTLAYGESTFSTSSAQARVPVELTDVGVRTVLPAGWQLVGAGAFEQVTEGGERRRLTFERLPGDDPEAVLRARNESSSAPTESAYGDQTWLWQAGSDRDGRRFVQATTVGGNVYLITAEATDESPVELYAFVLPLVLENFEVIGADEGDNGAGAAPPGTSQHLPALALRRSDNRDAEVFTPAPETGTVAGTVRWHHTPLAGVRVSLRTPRERLEDGSCCVGEQETLQTVSTDENGTYRFEGVTPGEYEVEAEAPSSLYWEFMSSSVNVSAAFEVREDFRLQKVMEVVSPHGEMGVPLSPTLRWKPFPGAARYQTYIHSERTGNQVRSLPSESTEVTLNAPLEPNELYQWSVTAYAEDGTEIAYYSAAHFSTAPAKEQVSVTLPDLGLQMMLFEDWQQVTSNTFEWAHEGGTTYTLAFQTLPGDDAEAALLELGATEEQVHASSYEGKTWWTGVFNGVVRLATELEGQVYLIAADSSPDGTAEFSYAAEVEALGFTLPLVARTLERVGAVAEGRA